MAYVQSLLRVIKLIASGLREVFNIQYTVRAPAELNVANIHSSHMTDETQSQPA